MTGRIKEAETIEDLRKRIRELEAELERAKAAQWPPASVVEALNSGDGIYRP